MLTEARPVRMFAMAFCKSVSAFSMRDFAFPSTSFTLLKLLAAGAAVDSGFIAISYGPALVGPSLGSRLVDERSDRLTLCHTHYIAMHGQVENYDRQTVIPAHRHCGSVHHTEISRQDLRSEE